MRRDSVHRFNWPARGLSARWRTSSGAGGEGGAGVGGADDVTTDFPPVRGNGYPAVTTTPARAAYPARRSEKETRVGDVTGTHRLRRRCCSCCPPPLCACELRSRGVVRPCWWRRRNLAIGSTRTTGGGGGGGSVLGVLGCHRARTSQRRDAHYIHALPVQRALGRPRHPALTLYYYRSVRI